MAFVDQVSDTAVRAVARRLKHYLDVERREDGFDTSGPLKLLGDYRVGKGLGGTFHYNSLQDKHMQHYFEQPNMRKHLVEMGIAQPGMFHQNSKSRRRSRSAGQGPRLAKCSRTKSESAHLMENSAKVLMEQGPQLHLLAQTRTKKSNRSVSHSISSRTSRSTHSNHSNSGCSLPRREQRNSIGSSQSDVVLSVNSEKQVLSSRSSIVSQRSEEDNGAGETLVPSGKSSPSPSYGDSTISHHDTPDALTNSQTPEGGSPCQQVLFTQDSPSILPIPAGVTNVRSNNAVIQTSVSVSTVTCNDASTQTLVHAETQTDQSTLFKMALRQQKRTKRDLKTKLKDEKGATRNGSGTFNGSTQTTVPLSQNETKAVGDESTAIGKTTAKFRRESQVHTYIHKLAASGDIIKIKELLAENPALVSSVNEQGHTPLHIASIAGKSQIVEVLRSFGAELMTETPTGYTAMHCAAMYGNLDCLKVLHSMKCNVNCQTVDEQTPLHLAVMSGQLECCQWLVANKANLNAKDSNERTPYDIAKETDHQEIALHLMSNDHLKATLSLDGGVKLPAGTNSNASLNLEAESGSNINTGGVNIDNEVRHTLSETETAEKDSHTALLASATEGEDNQTVDDPHHTHHPTHNSTEPQGGTDIARQTNMETSSVSDYNLNAASLESNLETFFEAKTDSDTIKLTESQDEDAVLNCKGSKERTPSPDSFSEVRTDSDAITLKMNQDEDPIMNENSSEYNMERSSSPEAEASAAIKLTENEDPILNKIKDNSSEHKIEKAPSLEAFHKAHTDNGANELPENQDKDPVPNEMIGKSSEHETERSLSLTSQQHRPTSPAGDLREIESTLPNISDLQLSSDSATSISPLD